MSRGKIYQTMSNSRTGSEDNYKAAAKSPPTTRPVENGPHPINMVERQSSALNKPPTDCAPGKTKALDEISLDWADGVG